MNILAKVYFAEVRIDEAQTLFGDLVWRDERNQNVREVGMLSHRALCRECFKEIKGIRQKCTNRDCASYDWYSTCVNVNRAVVGSRAHDRRIRIPGNLKDGAKIASEAKAGVKYGCLSMKRSKWIAFEE